MTSSRAVRASSSRQPGPYSVSAASTAAEGGSAALTVTLSEAAPAGGVTFTVTASYGGGPGFDNLPGHRRRGRYHPGHQHPHSRRRRGRGRRDLHRSEVRAAVQLWHEKTISIAELQEVQIAANPECSNRQ